MIGEAARIMNYIKGDAIFWSAEEGLRLPLEVTNAQVTDFGFKLTVVEKNGGKMATCTFTSRGMRSMWELDKKGG